MAALLKDALAPNLVQTLEGSPVLVHAGPFANIAHGCNSVVATRAGLALADLVVSEAGFGSDLGAEKFVDIKCRQSGLRPAAAIIVATLTSIKHHGGAAADRLEAQNPEALERGLSNLARHLGIVREVLGIPCVVCLNRFSSDSERELAYTIQRVESLGVAARVSEHWSNGGSGARALAQEVLRISDSQGCCRFAYDEALPLIKKLEILTTDVYGGAEVRAEPAALRELEWLEARGFGHLPVCVAKTQHSLSADPGLRGAASDHVVPLTELRLAAGAGFVVALCGDMTTMPGLPSRPRAESIELLPDGRITGLD